MLTVAQFLLRYLERSGIRRIFGVPGRENASILFNEAPKLEFITGRVEFNAGIMAEFCARSTLAPHAVFCTMGPGATNMVTAAASAMLNKSPLLVVSAQLERHDRYYNLTHQCVDQRRIFAPVTKWSHELESARELPGALREAFGHMLKEPVGPVHLSIPTDLYHESHAALAEQELPSGAPKVQWPAARPSTESLLAAAEWIDLSRQPLCLVGQEVVRAGAVNAVRRFCEAWNIPALCSANAKGIFPFEHELYLDSASPYMEGILGYPGALDDLFADIDLILNVGYQYADDILPRMWQRGREKRVIHLSAHSAEPIRERYRVDLELLGPIADILESLLPDHSRKKTPLRVGLALKERLQEMALRRSCDGYLTPVEVIDAVNRSLGAGTLIADIGYFRHHAVLFSRPRSVGQFFTDAGLSSFGSGLPSAIAAQLLDRTRPVFLLSGDGGFHSGSCELETLSRYRLPIVVIVLNNASFGLIERYQQRGGKGSNPSILQFGRIDFAALARANGVQGVKVNGYAELDDALRRRDPSSPLLVEVPLKYSQSDEFRESF